MMLYKANLYGVCMQHRISQVAARPSKKASLPPNERFFKAQDFMVDNNTFGLLLTAGKGVHVVTGSLLKRLNLHLKGG